MKKCQIRCTTNSPIKRFLEKKNVTCNSFAQLNEAKQSTRGRYGQAVRRPWPVGWLRRTCSSLTAVYGDNPCTDGREAAHLRRSHPTLRQNWCWKKQHHLQHMLGSKQSKTRHPGPVETGRADLDRYCWLCLILQLGASARRETASDGTQEKTKKKRFTFGRSSTRGCTRGAAGSCRFFLLHRPLSR